MQKICSLLLILVSLSLKGQNYLPKFYTIDNGLPSNTCYTVFQDSKGFLWAGTNVGVSRFNGTSFTNYELKDGILGYSVYQIHEDSQGRIWFLTDTGRPCFYQNGKIFNDENTAYLNKMRGDSYLYGFLEDKLGQIWIGSDRSGIKVLQPGNGDNKSLKIKSPIGIYRVSHFFENGDEVLAVTSDSIVAFDSKNLQIKWTKPIFEESANVIRAASFGQNKVIIQNQNQRIIFDIALRKVTKSTTEAKYHDVLFVSNATKSGNLIGRRNGIYALENGIEQSIDRFDILKNQSISGAIQDKAGNWWLSTLKSGIIRFSDYPFKFLNNEKGLYLKKTFDSGAKLKVYNNGKLSLKSDILDGYENFSYSSPNLPPLDAIELDSNKYLIFNENYITLIEENNLEKWVVAAKSIHFEKETEEIFLGLSRGIIKTNIDNLTDVLRSRDPVRYGKLIDKTLLTDKWVNSIKKVNETIFIGTREGLFLLEENSVSLASNNKLVKNSNILKVLPWRKNHLLLITYGNGLIILNTKTDRTQNINSNEGLSNNFLRTAIMDRDSTVWLLSKKGLSSVELLNGVKIQNYSEADGISLTEIYYLFEEDGQLFFNGPKGQCISNSQVIRSFRLRKPEIIANTFTQNTFKVNQEATFSFQTLSFEFGEGLETFYKLSPDSVWTSFQKTLRLNSPQSGEFTLAVKAVGNENVSSEILEIPVIFEYPWYRKSFFQVLFLTFIGLVTFGLFKSGTLSLNTAQLKENWQKLKRLSDLQLAPKKLVIKTTDGSFIKIKESEIVRITAAGNYVEYFTESQSFLSRITMKELESQIGEKSLLKRVHRSHFVNQDMIQKVVQHKIILKDFELSISKNYLSILDELKANRIS